MKFVRPNNDGAAGKLSGEGRGDGFGPLAAYGGWGQGAVEKYDYDASIYQDGYGCGAATGSCSVEGIGQCGYMDNAYDLVTR